MHIILYHLREFFLNLDMYVEVLMKVFIILACVKFIKKG